MIALLAWMVVYSVVVAASIMLIGKPSIIMGTLGPSTFVRLLLDWRFLLGGVLALGARFIFVIINNIAAKIPNLSGAHLSIAAIATSSSIVFIILANQLILGEQLRLIQVVGAAIVIVGLIIALR